MKRDQRQILRSLLVGPKTFWQLIREQDSHLARFTTTLASLKEEGLITETGHLLELTEKGREIAQSSGLIPLISTTCSHCSGRGITFEGLFQKVLEEFKEIAVSRPEAIPEFDQGFIEPEITVARVVFMYARGDLEGQKLLFVGDDDLTSIAAALTGMAEEITVLEIDQRLLEFIDQVAAARQIKNLRTCSFDVRKPLPPEFARKYDVFFTDPVETVPGIKLFLSRCVQGLKGPECSGYLGLTHLEASRQKWHTIQKMFLEMGLVITDLVRDFHSYELERATFLERNYPLVRQSSSFHLEVPDLNWYTSSLIRLEAVQEPQPLVSNDVELGRELYFDDEAYATLPDPSS
jgi:predicted methyltransferase